VAALTLLVRVFCWASSESLEPPPQAARKLPIIPITRLFAIVVLMVSLLVSFRSRPTFHSFSSCLFCQLGIKNATGQNERQVVLINQNQLHTSHVKAATFPSLPALGANDTGLTD
jgi:hypothetical protein